MKEGSAAYKLRQELVEAARAYKAEGHSHEEVAERFGKSIAWSNTWCKGIAPQGDRPIKQPRNGFTNGQFDRVANARRIIEKHNADWEYAGGFTGVDDTVLLRCKKCGAVSERSMITIRHKHCRCRNCERLESNKRACEKVQKRMSYASLLFNAGKQMSLKFCACGQPIDSTRRVCSPCAKRRANRYYNDKKDKRRLMSYTKETSQIDVKSLYDRDAGVCWICGELCDIQADPNSNLYPSIDHIVPVSKGGKDTWANVKLAHRICNSKRGNKTFDTLPLQKTLDGPLGPDGGRSEWHIFARVSR